MNSAPSQAAPDSSRPAHAQEARLLGATLRSSRLALLIGETGSDKTAFLKSGLMPLLRRRTGDRATPTSRESGVVVTFPDRRHRAYLRAAKRRELIVYFDDWANDAPLAALRTCIHRVASASPAEQPEPAARLSETLAALSSRLDATFIVLLDRFEELLQQPPDREDVAQFANELVEAINHAALPASFLISLNEEARPRLAGLRSRIPGFDDFSLKLARPQGSKVALAALPVHGPDRSEAVAIATTPVLSERVALPDTGCVSPPLAVAAAPGIDATIRPKKKAKLPRPPRAPVTTGDVYAFIEATLAVTAPDVASEPFSAAQARAEQGRTYAPEVQAPNSQATARGSEASQTRGTALDAIAKRLGRLLHPRSRAGP